MKRLLSFVAVAVVLLVLQSQDTLAACRMIPQPDAAYRGATNRCLLPGSFPSSTTMCNVGGTTVALYVPQVQVRIVGQQWATWSSPPESEESFPQIGFTTGTELTNWLMTPATTAGFELETNSFSIFEITVQFWNDSGTMLGSVTRDVEGRAGARLFAMNCDDPISHMRAIVPSTAQGFAVAQLRSNSFPAADEEEVIEGADDPKPVSENSTSNTEIGEIIDR